jgi:hypothetical protein
MTYLDLVNNVLRRMREDEVSNVSETTYSKMVGDFINDAKKLVEAAWDWSGLRTTLTVNTEAGIFSYSLVGSQNRVKALDVLNDTSNFFMEYRGSSWFNDKYLNRDVISGEPRYYTYNGIDSNGDSKVEFYPKPDDVYEIRFNVILRNSDLANNSDILEIPAMPVIHLAIALLARERGETGGTAATEYFAIADKHLSDAVALDAQKHSDEVVWYPC